MTDEQIEKCRVSLWVSAVTICANEDMERLIQFERLDALAHQPCQWCDENPCKEWDECYGPNKTAERLLAEFVAAVLMGEVKP